MSIDAAVASKLVEALGHDRVYPDARWFVTDKETGEPIRLAEKTVVMYRQTGGNAAKSLDQGRGSLRDDFFLIEVFSDFRESCSEVRDQLMRFFSGPLDAKYPGRWQTWGSPKTPCPVHWAEIDDPVAGSEFPESDAHLLFRFVRLVMSVQWHMG